MSARHQELLAQSVNRQRSRLLLLRAEEVEVEASSRGAEAHLGRRHSGWVGLETAEAPMKRKAGLMACTIHPRLATELVGKVAAERTTSAAAAVEAAPPPIEGRGEMVETASPSTALTSPFRQIQETWVLAAAAAAERGRTTAMSLDPGAMEAMG